MLRPDELLHISEGAEEIAEKLHNDIIKRIIDRVMLRIGRGEDYLLTATDKWQIENLQQAGYLLEDIQKDIAKATKLQQTEIAEAMEDAGVKALDYDDRIYQAAGLSPTPLTKSPELIRLMQRNYQATMGEWSNFTRTMANEAQRLFIGQLDKAYTLVATGALSYTQAVKEVLNNVLSDGVEVRYPTGHKDTIETATLRAVRTGVSQATAQIQLGRMAEMDCDKVIVSSHLGARPSHHVWQGKVFTVEELRSTNEGMPAYGTVGGLCGANCRHSFSPWFDGMDNPFKDYDSEENLKQYEKEQRQRELERRIRKTKREVMGLKESVDVCKNEKLKFELDMDYQRKSALLAKQNAAYKEYCERNNLKPLNDRIQIARWDRQQAAAARGAAKRYKNAHGGSVSKEWTPIKTESMKRDPSKFRNQEKESRIITIEDANKTSTALLAKVYDSHRISDNLTSVPYEELGEGATDIVFANYGKMSVESAKAFNDTIEELASEYDTPLQRIRTMTREEFFADSSSFAFVSHDYSVDSAELVINTTKCKDLNALKERIKELSEQGYCVRVADDMTEKYVATHEFSHTILNMQNKLNNKTNWVNADYNKIRDARKEIENLYESYMKKLSEIDSKVKDYESKIFEYMMDGAEAPIEIENLYNKYYDEYQELLISEYSLVNSDEFMAEAFTEGKIGMKKSEYSQKVIDIMDKYFKR